MLILGFRGLWSLHSTRKLFSKFREVNHPSAPQLQLRKLYSLATTTRTRLVDELNRVVCAIDAQEHVASARSDGPDRLNDTFLPQILCRRIFALRICSSGFCTRVRALLYRYSTTVKKGLAKSLVRMEGCADCRSLHLYIADAQAGELEGIIAF